MASRATLASIEQKLDSFVEQMQQYREDDKKTFAKLADAIYGNGKPGLTTRIELNEAAIDEIKESRNRSLKAVWSTLVVVVGALILKILKG